MFRLIDLSWFQNGDIIAATSGPSTTLRLEAEADGWIVARCTAKDGAMAITSPIATRNAV